MTSEQRRETLIKISTALPPNLVWSNHKVIELIERMKLQKWFPQSFSTI